MGLIAGLELSLLLVCLWGFVAVLLTGQFSAVVIIPCMVALVIGYRLRRSGWRPTMLVANIAAITVFLIAIAIYIGTYNLLIATVYLFLFLQVTKYVTRQNLVEARWCYIISLFNVIGASVITTAITFGLMLIVYVFLTLTSLRLYVMAREWEDARKAAGNLKLPATANYSPSSQRLEAGLATLPLPRRLLLSATLLTIVILLLSGAIFSAIPRLATQNLFQTYGPPQEDPAVSAFSENVEFGAFTEIQLDDAIALFVQPQQEDRPSHIRMRGVALDTFDGKAWSRTGPSTTRNNIFEFRPIFTTRVYRTEFVHQVIQPPGITNFLFGDSFPLEISLPPAFQFYVDPMAQSAYLSDMPPKEFKYQVTSMHEDLSQRVDPTTMDSFHRPPSHLMYSRASMRDHGYADDYEIDAGMDAVLDEVGEWLEDETSVSETWKLFVEAADTSESAARRLQIEDYRRRRFRGYGRGPDDWNRYMQRRQQRDNTTGSDTLDDRQWGYGGRGFIRLSPQEYLHVYLTKCLALPEMLSTGRVADLAQDWTGEAETTFTKAIAVERRLRTEYGYSLTPQASGNYIDSFLFDVQEGHCEYFATSMAVLLRNIGIPARVVNGYFSNEWNNLSENFTVRQKDAHSWVEAWMGDDYGWMTFDPTPPSGVSRRTDRGAFLESISRLSDAIRMRWYRYVVDYSFTDQMLMVREVLQWRHSIMQKLKNLNILGISAEDATHVEFGNLSGDIDWRPIALSGLIIVALLFWQGILWIFQIRKGRYSLVSYYDKLLRLLARRGFTIKRGQTPREFAQQVVSEQDSLKDFARITEIYYANRFRNTPPGPELINLFARVRRELKRYRNK